MEQSHPISIRPSTISPTLPFYLRKASFLFTFFFFSTLIHSLQLLSFIFLSFLPFSATKRLHERIIDETKLAFGVVLLGVVTRWGMSTFRFSGEGDWERCVRRNGEGEVEGFDWGERTIFISNHQQYVDWVYIWILLYFGQISTGLVITLKASLMWVPILGSAMQFFEFIFISKSRPFQSSPLAKIDEEKTRAGKPFALLVFPEGTLVSRLTRPRSKAFSEKMGIPDLDNMLLPRSTGLLHALRTLTSASSSSPSSPPAPPLRLYNLTIGYPHVPAKGYAQDYYTLVSSFGMGFSPELIHIHIEEIDLEQVPFRTTDERTGMEGARGKNSSIVTESELEEKDVAKKFEGWLRGVWKDKDERMTRFYENGDFSSTTPTSRLEASTPSSNLLSSRTESGGGGAAIDWDPKMSNLDLMKLGRIVIPMMGLWSYVIWITMIRTTA